MLKTAAPGCYLHIHVTTTHIVQSIRDVQVVYTNHPDFRHKILPLYSACVPHERNPSTIYSTRVALWLLVNLLLRPNSGGVDVCAVQGGGGTPWCREVSCGAGRQQAAGVFAVLRKYFFGLAIPFYAEYEKQQQQPKSH